MDTVAGEIERSEREVGVIILETTMVGGEDIESTLVDDLAAFVSIRQKTVDADRKRDLYLEVEERTPQSVAVAITLGS